MVEAAGGVVEEGGEGFVDAGGVGVAGLAVVEEGGFEEAVLFLLGGQGNAFGLAEAFEGFVGDLGEGEVEAEVGVVGEEGAAGGGVVVFPGLQKSMMSSG
jgi:hypothetical protein